MLRCVVLASILVNCLVTGASHLDGRIVGGNEASIEDYPYQLSLERSGVHICGASIISANYALTAAHCGVVTTVPTTTLRAGSSTRGTGGTVHNAIEIIVHPKYNTTNDENDWDVAVIKVSPPFPATPSSQIIPLSKTAPAVGTVATTSGWGRTVNGGLFSPTVLRSVRVPIFDHEECNDAYEVYGGITGNMICAGVEGGGKDTCQGDSGGPLVVGGDLVGVVSWGIGCGSLGYPGVYANVASLREWIVENALE